MRKIIGLLLGVFVAGSPALHAQSWPNKPVRIIVPIAPGSTLDIMARIVAPRLATGFGQQVLVENRPGAGGGVGIEATARAPKDGNTVVLAAMGLAIIPALSSKLAWDPVRDFAPIALLVKTPQVMAVNDTQVNILLKLILALILTQVMMLD